MSTNQVESIVESVTLIKSPMRLIMLARADVSFSIRFTIIRPFGHTNIRKFLGYPNFKQMKIGFLEFYSPLRIER